jgi:membrane complex biogenesis BtpA family protein
MKHESFLSLFEASKPIIGMVHLGKLAEQDGFISENAVVESARHDIDAWQRGGVNGFIIENWLEDSVRPTIPRERAKSMERVSQRLRPWIQVPFGVNVLNNDYNSAYRIAGKTGASFIQLDVLVDRVVSDFMYNDAAKKHPFTIDISAMDVRRSASKYGLPGLPILAGIHPKHYRLLDMGKTIEQSAREAQAAGVGGIVLTKATGVAPMADVFTKVRQAVDTPLGLGSGLTAENASELLPFADFAIVGTYAKIDGVTENPVDEHRVKRLMRVVYDISKYK